MRLRNTNEPLQAASTGAVPQTCHECTYQQGDLKPTGYDCPDFWGMLEGFALLPGSSEQVRCYHRNESNYCVVLALPTELWYCFLSSAYHAGILLARYSPILPVLPFLLEAPRPGLPEITKVYVGKSRG